MTNSNHCYAVIEPIDSLLFGDNRSARAGIDHLQLDQDPSPLTIHGALGRFIWEKSGPGFPTHLLGKQVEDILNPDEPVAELLGVAFRDPSAQLWFPRPLNLRCWKTVGRDRKPRYWSKDLLVPSEIADQETSCKLPRLLISEPLQHETDEPLLVSELFLSRILRGEVQEESITDYVRCPTDVYRPDVRLGIAIQNATGQTEEGMFFSRPYRRFGPAAADGTGVLGWSFAAWLATPETIPNGPPGFGFIGGDRRRARFHLLSIASRDEILRSVRDDVISHVDGSRGFLTYLLTPRIIDEASQCQVGGADRISTVTGRPQFVSGWNTRMPQHPRPLIALEPAGSIHFFEWPAGADKAAFIREHWLSNIGRGGAAGFGRILLGVWP